MVYAWSELVEIEGGASNVIACIASNKYTKVSHGIYVDNGEAISELEQLFVRYPRATLTLQSAFEYYGLSDYVPEKYHVVTPYNAHVISNIKICQSYMNEEEMQVGRDKVITPYGHIYIFDKERMLIELFRLKRKLPSYYFLEIVSSYRDLKAKGDLNMKRVSEYCKRIGRGKSLLKLIMEMI